MTSPSLSGTPAVVLDTNVISYWVRGHAFGQPYSLAFSGMHGVVSMQTVAELLRWSIEAQWLPRRTATLRSQLDVFTRISITEDIAEVWAATMARGKLIGRPMSTADAWIAATALVLGIPLMTHNRRDFEGIPGLDIISFG